MTGRGVYWYKGGVPVSRTMLRNSKYGSHLVENRMGVPGSNRYYGDHAYMNYLLVDGLKHADERASRLRQVK